MHASVVARAGARTVDSMRWDLPGIGGRGRRIQLCVVWQHAAAGKPEELANNCSDSEPRADVPAVIAVPDSNCLDDNLAPVDDSLRHIWYLKPPL